MNISLNLLKKLIAVEEAKNEYKQNIEDGLKYLKPILDEQNYDQMRSGFVVRGTYRNIVVSEYQYQLINFIIHHVVLKMFYNSISKVGRKTFIKFFKSDTRVRLPKVSFIISKQEEIIKYDAINHTISISEEYLLNILKKDFDIELEQLRVRIESKYLEKAYNTLSRKQLFEIVDVLKNVNKKIEEHKVNLQKFHKLSTMKDNILSHILSTASIEFLEEQCFRDDYLCDNKILESDLPNKDKLRNFLKDTVKIQSLIKTVEEDMKNSDCRIHDFDDATIELDINFDENIVKYDADARVYGEFESYSGQFQFEF